MKEDCDRKLGWWGNCGIFVAVGFILWGPFIYWMWRYRIAAIDNMSQLFPFANP
jgi:hypothetical protein